MDPNANLEEQREIVRWHASSTAMSSDYDRLADLVEALDTWLTKGGAMPSAWTAASGVRA